MIFCKLILIYNNLTQLPLLLVRWKQVLLGAMFQYVHGMSTQLAHRMHQPQEEPLGDLGFKYLPVRSSFIFYLCCSSIMVHAVMLMGSWCVQELGLERAWISETIFWSLFIPFILWSFSPFVTVRKRFYTAVIYARILVVLSCALLIESCYCSCICL